MGILSKANGVLVAKVEGGLGNQLFIYATARRLAVNNDVPLKLDITSGYVDDIYNRSYRLDNFNIDATVASLYDSYMSAWGQQRRYVARKINKILPFHHRFYVVEKGPFDRRLLDLRIGTKVYLQGYWQDERYFKDFEQTLRRELTLAVPLDEENRKWKDKIQKSNAICLHARRNQYEHALPTAYYEKAIEYLARKVNDPHFFCFSDNPDWILKNLRINFPLSLVSHNDSSDGYKDLILMTACKHYIIANSSFSWWGAWLNPDPNKMVLAPKNWGYRTAIPDTWKPIAY